MITWIAVFIIGSMVWYGMVWYGMVTHLVNIVPSILFRSFKTYNWKLYSEILSHNSVAQPAAISSVINHFAKLINEELQFAVKSKDKIQNMCNANIVVIFLYLGCY